MLISLERDVTPYVIGREKVYERGSTLAARIWVTNDHLDAIDGAEVSWELASADSGEVREQERLHEGVRHLAERSTGSTGRFIIGSPPAATG